MENPKNQKNIVKIIQKEINTTPNPVHIKTDSIDLVTYSVISLKLKYTNAVIKPALIIVMKTMMAFRLIIKLGILTSEEL